MAFLFRENRRHGMDGQGDGETDSLTDRRHSGWGESGPWRRSYNIPA